MGTSLRKKRDMKLDMGKERNKFGSCRDKRGGAEVGIRGGVSGTVSGDDDVISEPDGET